MMRCYYNIAEEQTASDFGFSYLFLNGCPCSENRFGFIFNFPQRRVCFGLCHRKLSSRTKESKCNDFCDIIATTFDGKLGETGIAPNQSFTVS